jgi:hypothetical protein
LAEDSSKVLFVLFGRPGEDEDVVQIYETEIESPQNVVHEALQRLGGDEQAERHEGEVK